MLNERETPDAGEQWDDGISSSLPGRIKRQLSVEDMFKTEQNWDQGREQEAVRKTICEATKREPEPICMKLENHRRPR